MPKVCQLFMLVVSNFELDFCKLLNLMALLTSVTIDLLFVDLISQQQYFVLDYFTKDVQFRVVLMCRARLLVKDGYIEGPGEGMGVLTGITRSTSRLYCR